jgi:hypothetical protein
MWTRSRGLVRLPGKARQRRGFGEVRVLAGFGPGAAGGMPRSRASLRMYAAVNGERRSTSDGPRFARSAAMTASIMACRDASCALSVSL